MRWLPPALMMFASTAVADHELDGRDLEQGRQLYVENCASCHGKDLEGQPNWRSTHADGTLPAPPHDATGHTWHHDNQLLFEYTKFGGQGALAQRGVTDFNSGMPAFEGSLSDAEVWAVLAYIRSTWSEREKQVQASRNPAH